MEELVGKIWHRLVWGQSQVEFDSARVTLNDCIDQLAPYYRALGGDTGIQIEAATPRRFKIQRRFLQRLAGSHQYFSVSWQDQRSLRLPKSIALFPDAELNKYLYFWLAALAARRPTLNHWFGDNQQACLQLLQDYPGLKKRYASLAEATLVVRDQTLELEGDQLVREQAIRRAILSPGSERQLPLAPGSALPVPLWLYSQPIRLVCAAAEDHLVNAASDRKTDTQDLSEAGRKEATRIDDSRETDGLMVFQLESLFTWGEQVSLDRCQEEEMDDDLNTAAQDLDIISVSRQRRAGAAKVKFDLDLPAAENDDLPLGEGIRLPEWDYRKSKLVQDYCLLQPMLADNTEPAPLPDHLRGIARKLRHRFAILRPERQWLHRQASGEELDLAAYLDALTDPGAATDLNQTFKSRKAVARDLSCLLLADLSMSTDAALTQEQRVIDVIRDTLLLFAEALSGSGDQFAMYGFSSVKNKQVRYHLLKNFAESYSDHTRGRLLSIKPGFYTRMGAAVRQSTAVLKLQKTQQRLLLIVSDGKPNDIDQYEGRYGIEDTRQAIFEARAQGVQPFCVTVDDKASDYLPYLFGSQGYEVVSDAQRLPEMLPKLYLNLTGVAG